MNEFELAKKEIDDNILISINNVGSKHTFKQFHTIIEGNISNETCDKIKQYYMNNGWEFAECKSSKTINEETKDEYNLDRKYNRTGILLKNFISKTIIETQK